MSQNQEQASSESQQHSEPIDATVKETSDEIQTVTESIANMKTEQPNSIITSEAPSQNEPEPSQSKEIENCNPPVASPIPPASETISTNEKGIILQFLLAWENKIFVTWCWLSQINTNLTLLLFTDEEEEDDKPRPPDDDSVPDMEESFSTDGVGHDVDEYINNNISNDEVGNVNDFYPFLTDFNKSK